MNTELSVLILSILSVFCAPYLEDTLVDTDETEQDHRVVAKSSSELDTAEGLFKTAERFQKRICC